VKKKVFWTADQHFGHRLMARIRGFGTDIEAMNETMVDSWNEVVRKDDIVYHLGDLAYRCSTKKFMDIFRRLNGEVRLIAGNHDKKILKHLGAGHPFGAKVKKRQLISVKRGKSRQEIVLSHYPMRTWQGSNRGSWMLCGHSHGNLFESSPMGFGGGLLLDVSVDAWGYSPVSLEEVEAVMKRKREKTLSASAQRNSLEEMCLEEVFKCKGRSWKLDRVQAYKEVYKMLTGKEMPQEASDE